MRAGGGEQTSGLPAVKMEDAWSCRDPGFEGGCVDVWPAAQQVKLARRRQTAFPLANRPDSNAEKFSRHGRAAEQVDSVSCVHTVNLAVLYILVKPGLLRVSIRWADG